MGKIFEGLSPLNESIDQNILLLQSAREKREELGNEFFMSLIVDRTKDKSEEVERIIEKEKTVMINLVKLAAKTIVEASDGNLAVTFYKPKNKGEQKVFIFVNTHWAELDQQDFFDLVKDCCIKLGLKESNYESPNFMQFVFHAVAFRIARKRTSKIPKGEEWINVSNGTLEIKRDGTRRFRAHNREDFFTYCLSYPYDPYAKCDKFHAYLDKVIPDADTQQVLAEYSSYCLTKHMKLEKMLVLYGSGSNGKSVFLDILEAIFGKENVSNVALSDLTNDAEKRCAIENKRVNISFESNKDIDTSTLKLIVSGEPVDCRELYVGTHLMHEYAKLITSFNALPKAEATLGFYRRFLIVPFNVEITDKEKDIDLSKKIIADELPGILNWILDAMKGLFERKSFTRSAVCEQALERYKLSSDSVKLFVSECVVSGGESLTTGKELYGAYKSFCIEDNIYACGKHKFYDRIESLGFQRTEHQRNIFFKLRVEKNG